MLFFDCTCDIVCSSLRYLFNEFVQTFRLLGVEIEYFGNGLPIMLGYHGQGLSLNRYLYYV